jgi:hypothetical protein
MVKVVEFIIMVFFLIVPWWLLWKYGDSRMFPQMTLSTLLSSQTNTILTMILVNENVLEFPHRLLPHLTNIPLTFDYTTFPVIHAFFYQWTASRNGLQMVGIALVITSVITFLEYLMERYTDLINYNNWTWHLTFSSIFIILLLTRMAVSFWFRKKQKAASILM